MSSFITAQRAEGCGIGTRATGWGSAGDEVTSNFHARHYGVVYGTDYSTGYLGSRSYSKSGALDYGVWLAPRGAAGLFVRSKVIVKVKTGRRSGAAIPSHVGA